MDGATQSAYDRDIGQNPQPDGDFLRMLQQWSDSKFVFWFMPFKSSLFSITFQSCLTDIICVLRYHFVH